MSYLTFLPFSNCNFTPDLFLVLVLVQQPGESLEYKCFSAITSQFFYQFHINVQMPSQKGWSFSQITLAFSQCILFFYLQYFCEPLLYSLSYIQYLVELQIFFCVCLFLNFFLIFRAVGAESKLFPTGLHSSLYLKSW